jgi:hypothetical protein
MSEILPIGQMPDRRYLTHWQRDALRLTVIEYHRRERLAKKIQSHSGPIEGIRLYALNLAIEGANNAAAVIQRATAYTDKRRR